jgi:hypothetical protein
MVEFPCFDVFEISHSCWRMLPKFQMLMVDFALLFSRQEHTHGTRECNSKGEITTNCHYSLVLQLHCNNLGPKIPLVIWRTSPVQIPAPGRLYVIGENVGGGWAGNSDSSSRLTSALQILICYARGRPWGQGVSLGNWGFRQQGLTLDKNEENRVHIWNILQWF